jgi:hypothetical protein
MSGLWCRRSSRWRFAVQEVNKRARLILQAVGFPAICNREGAAAAS